MREKLIIIMLALVLSTGALVAQNIAGDWSGQLVLGGNHTLKLVFHISSEEGPVVTMDSPDQGAYGIAAEVGFLSSDSIDVSIPQLGVNYAGHLHNGAIEGTFIQGMAKLPLKLTPGEQKLNRPQTPQPPFPYMTEEVRIPGSQKGVTLAGTLTVPADSFGITPVVVMVTGSGLQNRDEELFGHKPFAVIADYLARRGIASLRYDDRGFGESVGNGFDATTEDFAADANSVIEWLRRRGGFSSVGLLGHSEGGQIGYMLGARQDAPDFIISVAGPAVKGTSTVAYQNKVALLKSGRMREPDAEAFRAAIEKAFEYKLAHPGKVAVDDVLMLELYPQNDDSPMTRQLAGSLREMLAAEADNPWMMYFLAYDPAADLSALKVPALLIYGESDTQVPSSLNIPVARRYAPEAVIKSYPGLNHLMQHALTGFVEEYGTIGETISEEVLAEIASFIKLASPDR